MAGLPESDYLDFARRTRARYPELEVVSEPRVLFNIDKMRRAEGRQPTHLGDAVRRAARTQQQSGLFNDAMTRFRMAESRAASRDGLHNVDLSRYGVPSLSGVRELDPSDYGNSAIERAVNTVGRSTADAFGQMTSAEEFFNIEGTPLNVGTRAGEQIGRIPGVGGVARTAFDVGASPATVFTAGIGPEASAAMRASGPAGRAVETLIGPSIRSGNVGARLGAETAIQTAGVTAGQEVTERTGNPLLGFAAGLAGGVGTAGAIGAGRAGIRAATAAADQSALRAASAPMESSLPMGISSAVPTEQGIRGVRNVVGAASPEDSARIKLITSLREERRLRATGIAKREIKDGRRAQAAAIRQAREQGIANGLSGDALLQAEQAAARGALRKTFPVPDWTDDEFGVLLSSLNSSPLASDFDVLGLGVALSRWRAGVTPPQPRQIQQIGRLLGGEVQGLADDLAREAKDYAQDQGMIRQTRELLDRLSNRQGAQRVRQAERQAAQEIDARIRALDPEGAPPAPRPSDETFQRATLEPSQNKGQESAIRRARAQVKAYEDGQRRLSGAAEAHRARMLKVQADDASRQMDALRAAQRKMERDSGRAVDARIAELDQREIDRLSRRVTSPETRMPILEDKTAAKLDAQERAQTARMNEQAAAQQQRARAGAAKRETTEAIRQQEALDRRYPNADMIQQKVQQRIAKAPASAQSAVKQVTDAWIAQNRVLLNGLDSNDAVNPLRMIEAAVRGDVRNPFLNGVLVREGLLTDNLMRSGLDLKDAKTIARMQTTRELMIRAQVSNPASIPRSWLETLKNARTGGMPDQIDGVIQQAKNSMFGLDFGVFGQQVLAAIHSGGIPAAVGIMNRIAMGLNIPHVRTLMADLTLPREAQYALDGLHTSIASSGLDPKQGTLLRRLGAPGEFVDDIVTPVIDKLTQWQFDDVLGGWRNLVFEGDLAMARWAGEDIANPLVRARAADNANHITSFARLATDASRRKLEGRVFTSPAMNRARVARVVDMAKLLSPTTNKQERLYAASMIASNMVALTGIGYALFEAIGVGEFEWDPSKPGYGKFTTRWKNASGQNYIIDFIPQDSVSRALSQSLRVIAEGSPQELDNIWARAGIGALGPVARIGAGAFGFSFDPEGGYRIGEYPDSPMDAVAEFAPIPPVASGALRGNDAVEVGSDVIAVPMFAESPSQAAAGGRYEDLQGKAQFDAIPRQTWETMVANVPPEVQAELEGVTNVYQWRERTVDAWTAAYIEQGHGAAESRREAERQFERSPVYRYYLDVKDYFETEWYRANPEAGMEYFESQMRLPSSERRNMPTQEQLAVMQEALSAAGAP